MITIYGISNCDSVQKAIKWLNARQVQWTFHNFREQGIDKETLELWLSHFPANKLINTRSTTYKELSEKEKQAVNDNSAAIALMMKYNTVIKRPVWDFGNGQFLLGWDEKALTQML